MIISIINMHPEEHYKIFSNDDRCLTYAYKNEYNEYFIHFDKKEKCYDFDFMEFRDNDYGCLVPMEKRGGDDFHKHCCTFGHWQRIELGINIELHKFVSKIVESLGWNK